MNQMQQYQAQWNTSSLDGLPGLQIARRGSKEWLWLGDLMSWTRRIRSQKESIALGVVIGALVMFLVQSASVSIALIS